MWPTGPNVLNFQDTQPIITNQQFGQKVFQLALNAEAPTAPAAWMSLCPGTQVTLKAGNQERPLNLAPKFRFDPEIFNQLPSGVLRWALLDGVMQARLVRCMAKATISNVIFGDGDGLAIPGFLGRPKVLSRADGDFQVHLSFAYTDAAGDHEIPLSDLTAHYTYTGQGWACVSAENTNLFPVALWNGGSLHACDGSWNNVVGLAANNGRLKLVSIPLAANQQADQKNAIQDSAAKYANLAQPTLEEVKAKALSNAGLRLETAQQATATLVYVLRNGISGNSDNLQVMYNWVLDPTNMPDGTSWINAFLERAASRETIENEIEKRTTAFRTLVAKPAGDQTLIPAYDNLDAAIKFMEQNK